MTENYDKIERLKQTMSIQTTSQYEDLIDDFIYEQVEKLNEPYIFIEQDAANNIYVTKGIADMYPCVVSHKDTVHDMHKDFKIAEHHGMMTAWNEKNEQVGIGGDDKVGVYITLEMLRHFDNIKVVFFSQEEIGCIGSSASDTTFFDNVGYIFECDRKDVLGSNTRDFVDNISGRMYSKSFKKIIRAVLSKYNYKATSGGLTDVDVLKDEVDICMANMSCGYFLPHTDQEYIITDLVLQTRDMVQELIETLGENRYKHKRKKDTWWSKWSGTSVSRSFVNHWDDFENETYCPVCYHTTKEINNIESCTNKNCGWTEIDDDDDELTLWNNSFSKTKVYRQCNM
jgi:tripeptide aminopeptidase